MSTFKLKHKHHEATRQILLRKYHTSRNNCGLFTAAMAKSFPELTRVAGFYFAPNGAAHGEHWWLEDADGNIIDPTADQWPSCGTGTYEKYDPTKHLLPKGTCISCGKGLLSRMGRYPCSKSCDEDQAAEWKRRTWGGPYDDEMELTCDADIAKYGLDVPALSTR